MIPRLCRTLAAHHGFGSEPESSMWGHHTVAKLCQMPGVSSTLRWVGTGLIRESVYGLWRWSGDLAFRGAADFCSSGSAILLRSKWRKLYPVGVEVHQKSLEPATVSGGRWRSCQVPLTSQTPCPGSGPPSPFQCTPHGPHKGSCPPRRDELLTRMWD